MRKMEIESWEELMAQEFAMFDQPEEDDWPAEEGYVTERGPHRWELDPASAEDYLDRTRGWVSSPSERWRHFGH